LREPVSTGFDQFVGFGSDFAQAFLSAQKTPIEQPAATATHVVSKRSTTRIQGTSAFQIKKKRKGAGSVLAAGLVTDDKTGLAV